MSGLEARVGEGLDDQGVSYEYETLVIPFLQPAKARRYTPDFVLPNGIIVEVKGQFTSADRQKHLMVRDEWPDLDIRFVFGRSSARLSKASKTTYARWCETNGFIYADLQIPRTWIREPPKNATALAAFRRLRATNNRR